MNLAVLGTGIMGAPIARNLAAAGHTVRVWNRTRAKAEGLGAEVTDSPAECVTGAEFVITMLSDGPAVEEAIVDALTAVPAGAVWVQMSTVGIAPTERLVSLASQHELAFVDAPVLGTRAPAEQGTLLVLAAGPDRVRTACAEVFDVIGRATVWVGEEPGRATALKLVVNHWIMNALENIAETVAFAQALGLDPRLFTEAISGGGMDMPYAQAKTETILAGDFAPSFTLRMARKDVGLILEAARNAGLELALAQATDERLGRAIELGHGEEDVSATYYASRPDTSG